MDSSISNVVEAVTSVVNKRVQLSHSFQYFTPTKQGSEKISKNLGIGKATNTEPKYKTKSLKQITKKLCHVSSSVNPFTKKSKIDKKENLREECEKLKNDLQQVHVQFKEGKEDWLNKEKDLLHQNLKLTNEMEAVEKNIKQMDVEKELWLFEQGELVNENKKLVSEYKKLVNENKKLVSESKKCINESEIVIKGAQQMEQKWLVRERELISENEKLKNELTDMSIVIKGNTEENEAKFKENCDLESDSSKAGQWKTKAEKLEKEMNFLSYIIDSYNIIKIDGIV